ncbi:MAG: Ger(x)C family spore germination protein [Firmicutes bacterium]|nr:Ger(x)C family spore germination protein [Bacillota bacterium]
MITLSRRRRLVWATVVATSLVASGCWDRVEVNDLAIVLAAAVDVPEEGSGYEITVELAQPAALNAGGGGGLGGSSGGMSTTQSPGAILLTARGASWGQVLALLQERASRRLEWSHLRAIVFSVEVARRTSVLPLLDFLSRFRQIHPHVPVLVADGRAEDVLAATPPLETGVGDFLRRLTRQRPFMRVPLYEFFRDAYEPGIDPVAPLVKVVQAAPVASRTIPSDVRLDGAALFDQRGRLAATLSDHVTRGLLWLRDMITQSTVTVRLPQGEMDLELLNAATRLHAERTPGGPRIRAEFWAEDDIVDNRASVDLKDPTTYAQISRVAAEEVIARAEEAIREAQRAGVDPFGFGQAIHRDDPEDWRTWQADWPARMREVPVDLTARIDVRRTGITANATLREGR